ncbi:MAG: TIGR02117 family protein [Moraxellaceae bacterium]|nr:TIGR02117 family protein [Moraxellaceae bacterium]MDZ4385785.1 TIGR02117 family protein [Moraxellaceae bacterium]
MKIFFAMCCALLLASCQQSRDVRPLDIETISANIPIHVVNHGWHVGLVLPAQYLNDLLPALTQRFSQANYYELGWGDDGFYQSEENTATMAFSALFTSKGAVLHVVSIEESPLAYFDQHEVATFCLDAQQLGQLAQFVADSFMLQDEELIMREPGRYGDSQFYQATGRYTLMHTCNRWTAEALDQASMNLPYRFMLTAGSVMRAVRNKGQSCVELK